MEGQRARRKMTIVFYSIDGQHLTVDCDYLKEQDDSINLYNFDDAGSTADSESWIGSFFKKNLVGWEQIR